MAPFTPRDKGKQKNEQINMLTNQCFNPGNLIVTSKKNSTFMSNLFLYSGDVLVSDVHKSIEEIRNNKSIVFEDWCPTGMKTSIN